MISTAHSAKFIVSSDQINGPLNLTETILSAQTSEPEWVRVGERFIDVEELGGVPVKYSVRQLGTVDHPSIEVEFLASTTNGIEEMLREHLNRVLGLEDNLFEFYQKYCARKEPISRTFNFLNGLRLMRGTNLYESLLCSILSQNNSAKRWNQIARLLMKNYGKMVQFQDGSSSLFFPVPATIAKLSVKELQSKTSAGYRAKSVVEVSRMIARREFELDRLLACDYERAHEMLLQLYGVGPKVADCFLLYGLGRLEAAPVDVWIHRIVKRLYFKRRKVSRPEAAEFLRERFGTWAGYAQLYLFDYARRMSTRGKTTRRLNAF